MPHLIVEYSANVDAAHGGPVVIDELIDVLHDAAIATGIAALDALRTRGAPREHYAVADRHADNMFIAVTVRLGAGRSVEDRQRLVNELMAAIDDFLGDAQCTMMLSVECQEIDPDVRINQNNVRALVAERADGTDRPS